MRKNLLLLIMFCLIATIGAKAEVVTEKTGLSIDGKTFTITTGAEGDVSTYFASNQDALSKEEITTLVVVGPMKKEDLSYLAENMKDRIHITTLDLTNAVFTTSNNLIFPTNGSNYLKTKLETIKFPKPATGTTMEIPTECMKDYKIKNVIIPVGYTKIGTMAFYDCPSINIINIPEGVTEICSNAFRQAAIQSVRFPSTLKTIDEAAFDQCFNITSLTIPASVTSIGAGAFNNCQNLKDVYVLGTTAPKMPNGQAFDIMTLKNNGGGYPYSDNDYQNAIKNKQTLKTINRNTYWDGDKIKFCLLHYPAECSVDQEKEYNDIDYKNATDKDGNPINYYLKGDDGVYYPTQEKGNSCYDKNTGWKQFVLAAKIKDNEIQPIPRITASRWYTMCFDFPMTKGQIESAFGDGTEVCRFQGVKYKTDDQNNLVATIDFSKDLYTTDTKADVTITEAGHPYMIHPAAAAKDNNTTPIYYVAGITTKNPNCTITADEGQVYDTNPTTKDEGYTYYAKGAYQFKGTLTGCDVKVGSYYLGLPTVNEDGTKDGYRCFFYCSNNNYYTSSGKEIALKLPAYAAALYEMPNTINYHSNSTTVKAKSTGTVFGGDAVNFTSESSTTGIENVESESNETSAKFADKVFSISGQLVRTGSSSLEGLAKGMYIVNGKKYIVR